MSRWLKKFQEMPNQPTDNLDTVSTASRLSVSQPAVFEKVDWNEQPNPAAATEPFNQHHMDAIKAGHQVPVWCGTLNEWTYWVRDEHTKEKLRNEGCILPIYTLGELCVVEHMPKEDIRRIHEIKQAFDGTLTQGGVITPETDPV